MKHKLTNAIYSRIWVNINPSEYPVSPETNKLTTTYTEWVKVGLLQFSRVSNKGLVLFEHKIDENLGTIAFETYNHTDEEVLHNTICNMVERLLHSLEVVIDKVDDTPPDDCEKEKFQRWIVFKVNGVEVQINIYT